MRVRFLVYVTSGSSLGMCWGLADSGLTIMAELEGAQARGRWPLHVLPEGLAGFLEFFKARGRKLDGRLGRSGSRLTIGPFF